MKVYISILRDIATVTIGATFRERIEPNPNGNVKIIQMKDLGYDNVVNTTGMTRINTKDPKPYQLVHKYDLIFRSRGNSCTAAIMNEEIANTIVSAPLFKITASRQHVIPGYLQWWINNPSSQSYFHAHAEGSLLKMVNKTVLYNLEVALPPLDWQKDIHDYFLLYQEEQRILNKLTEYRKQYAEKTLMLMASASNNESKLHTLSENTKLGYYQPTSRRETK